MACEVRPSLSLVSRSEGVEPAVVATGNPSERSAAVSHVGQNAYGLCLLATRDLGVSIYGGAALGGGTTVNWQTCLRLPDDVRAAANTVVQLAPANNVAITNRRIIKTSPGLYSSHAIAQTLAIAF